MIKQIVNYFNSGLFIIRWSVLNYMIIIYIYIYMRGVILFYMYKINLAGTTLDSRLLFE